MTEQEWEAKNFRRVVLAEKKSRGESSADEEAEFDRLQTECFDYLESKYPRTPPDLDRLAIIEKRLAEQGKPPHA